MRGLYPKYLGPEVYKISELFLFIYMYIMRYLEIGLKLKHKFYLDFLRYPEDHFMHYFYMAAFQLWPMRSVTEFSTCSTLLILQKFQMGPGAAVGPHTLRGSFSQEGSRFKSRNIPECSRHALACGLGLTEGGLQHQHLIGGVCAHPNMFAHGRNR